MKGRSPQQLADYGAQLDRLAEVLVSAPMVVHEIRDAFTVGKSRPSAATVYAWIRALSERGYEVKSRKRRKKIPGKSGQREREYLVERQ
jgi:transposase